MPKTGSKNESVIQKGKYVGEVECGPCKFETVALFKEIEKNQYEVQVSIKNKGSSSCPVSEYEGPAEVKDNGNGTLTAKGVVPYFKVEMEQTVAVTKSADDSLSLSTSLYGFFKLDAHVKPESPRVIESIPSAMTTTDKNEIQSTSSSWWPWK